MAFIWWLFARAGSAALFYGGGKTASCTTLYGYHKAQKVSGNYLPGDIVFFNFSGGTATQHVGIVESYDGVELTTIEGNTGSTNQANGGQVQRRTRALKYVVAAYRPNYEEDKQMDNTPSPSAKTAVEWAQKNGILLGNADGDLMLSSPCTRHQMCVFLRRIARPMATA